MAKKTVLSRLHQPVHPIIVAAAIIGVVLLFAVLPFIIHVLSSFPSSSVPPRITYVNVTPIPNITAAQTVPTVIFTLHTFTSPDLGISFDYVPAYNQPIHVQEVGDKVYLNARQDEPPLGKYVEVFSKNPSESLEQAIQKAVMQGYSLQYCPILPANLDKRLLTLHPAYQYVQIALPPFNTYQDRLKCPPVYTYNRQSGLVYFMMDTNHPNKYVFFNLGQDNVLGAISPPPGSARLTTTWDETIRFTGN